MPTTAEDARARRREQLLTAAKEAFAELGYHKASVSEIIRRAGVARGTFYLYFDGKQAVWAAILGETLAALRERIDPVDVDSAAPPPQTQLQAMLERVIDYLLGDQALARILFDRGLAPDAEATARVDAFFGEVHALVRRALEVGQELGLVRPCEPELTAAALLGAVRGIVEHRVRSGCGADDVPALVEELLVFAARAALSFEV